MKVLDHEIELSDKFLIEIQKETRKMQKNHYYDCSFSCPLKDTSYRGNCLVWSRAVMVSRNILIPSCEIRNCGEVFSVTLKYALNKHLKHNKI